ncbi:uncharacterized protein [Nicotiana sylvestris]|uniref:Nuclear factor related to kappa-B-binding protein n=2 Tax=Nicotiana TaxID=4085 RepID=A0A1S3Y7P6_TOBAC|nr:PREDICTED: nuclear factor related to kappa-B-binding protein-like [Nicotiana sylvestris]XP_016448225.1 PREDICTED: nuclear factor related to kappa-B-binding protein-like [Nicotiana tabacum]
MTSDDMPDKKDIRAANILLQMAKVKGCFAKEFPSRHVKHGVVKLSTNRLTKNTQKGGCRFGTDKLMKIENAKTLDLQSARATIVERKSRKRTFHSRETSEHLNLTSRSCTRNLQKAKEMKDETGAFRDRINPSIKPPKKLQSTCIVPTIPDTSSFSIIHLLYAVRIALITPLGKNNSLIFGKYVETNKKKQRKHSEGVSWIEKRGGCFSGLKGFVRKNLPSLATPEIVERVRLNTRDFRILEAKEPLQDLVNGVLKVFSSRTVSIGAKSQKALVVYERHSKSWSWIGPLPSSVLHIDHIEEETSPQAWGLPRKTLVKLVDSFAYWLKEGQEMQLRIGSLPKPPQELMQHINFSERLRESRAVKSLRTISPSCEEVRAYFRREETLRYTVPDRAFSYTALDGQRSVVAPLKSCSGKPPTKVRDHHILKHNRPPHFTVLCLVRDAAARLPGGVGTRADICVLVRDSQFIVEDISDLQVNQVVSGALDRLHYENDPCVNFEKKWRLWAYLHRDRQEEDFEYDSTCPMKRRKRAKKMDSEV